MRFEIFNKKDMNSKLSNRKQVAISSPAFPFLINFAYIQLGLEKLKIASWSSHFRPYLRSLPSNFRSHLRSLPSVGFGFFRNHLLKNSALQ